MAEKVAFIGLSNYTAQSIVRNLVTHSGRPHLHTPVTLYDPDASIAQTLHSKLPANKTRVATSIVAAVADASIIFTWFADHAALSLPYREMRGRLWVDFTSSTSRDSVLFGRTRTEEWYDYVDCAVFADPYLPGADFLLLVASGPADALTRLSTLSPSFSRRLITPQSYNASALRRTMKGTRWDRIASIDVLADVLDALCRLAESMCYGFYLLGRVAAELVEHARDLDNQYVDKDAVRAEIDELVSSWHEELQAESLEFENDEEKWVGEDPY